MERIEIVRNGELKKGESTQGIARDKAFEGEQVLFSRSTVAGGAKSGWHHHGSRELYAFIASGRLRLDYGKGGKKAVEAKAGDFLHIPAGLVHRDVNPDTRLDVVIVNILIGPGPPVINTPGP